MPNKKRGSAVGNLNREGKDALFRFLFGSEERKEYTLSLYNAINHTHYTNLNDLEMVQLEDVLYINYKNDVAFLLDNRLNMFEEQSSWNPNMPLRTLIYLASEYAKLAEMLDWDLYSRTQIKIPVPRCIVLYKGRPTDKAKQLLKLSDMFAISEKGDVEVKTTVYNINAKKKSRLLRDCPVLAEYAIVIERTEEALKGVSDKKTERSKLKAVINGLPDTFQIKPLLVQEQREVVTMLLTEFDAKKHDRHTFNDGKAEGRNEEHVKGLQASVEMLKPFCTDFEQLYQHIKANPLYQDVTEEEVKKLY